MSPIDHFIRAYSTSPLILAELESAQLYTSDGQPRPLGRETLAILAGVQYSVVHRTELCLYEKIPPSLLAYLERHARTYDDFPKMYHNHRGLTEAKNILEQKELARRSSRHWINESPEDCITRPVGTFRDWRERHFETLMGLAKTVLINPTVIMNYESGKTKELPQQLRRQFRKFGMSDNLIKQIANLPREKEKVTA